MAAAGLEAGQRARLDRWRRDPCCGGKDMRRRFVVVDVEASGLNVLSDRLIAIGAVAVRDGAIDARDAFYAVLRQERESSIDNILVHRIGGTEQREGEDPREVLLSFLEYLGASPLVAFHSGFDRVMIERALDEYLAVRPGNSWADLAWILPELFSDRMDRQASLDEWIDCFGISHVQRHHALSDAYATAQLLLPVLEKLPDKDNGAMHKLISIEQARRWLHRGK